jgi:hypothetical protein
MAQMPCASTTTRKFLLTEDFGQELGTALAALAVEQASPAVDEGKYVADVLTPTAQKLARLANNLPASMGPDGRGLLLNSYALIENRIGQQRGDSKALERAISAFSAALNERSRERAAGKRDGASGRSGIGLSRSFGGADA